MLRMSEVGAFLCLQSQGLRMNVEQIDGKRFYHAVVLGAHNVIKNRQFMNQINVFPVADGDTGTNLTHLMNAIMTSSRESKHLAEVINIIAEASLEGARGNSGIIFASFFNGFAQEIKDKSAVTIVEFAQIAKRAVTHAYDAVLEPVEGTVLTVMRQWANACLINASKAKSFADMLSAGMLQAEKALEETSKTLKACRAAHVVDSGAYGFVAFMQGFLKHIKEGAILQRDHIKILDDIPLTEDDHHVFEPDHPPSNRYCTEALISHPEGLDLKVVRRIVKPLGDSSIVAGREDHCRIHIHTNTPATLFKELRDVSVIEQQKVEDMRMQHAVIHHRRHKVAIVTDTNADIPGHFADKHQIHWAPLNLHIENSTYLDKLTITQDALYDMLDDVKEYPSTSQPSLKTIDLIYGFLSQHYDSILVISLSSQLSGTYQAMKKAAEKYVKKGYKIDVLDSKLASAAQGILAMVAANRLDEGMEHDELLESLEKDIDKFNLFVTVVNTEYMMRSGRLQGVKAFFARATGIKPLLGVDASGKIDVIAKSFTQKACEEKLIQAVLKQHQATPISYYAIVHVDAYETAKHYETVLTNHLGQAPLYVLPVSAAIGLHAGKGSVAVAIFRGSI